MKEKQKFSFKIAVIGDSQVGKTSLMEKFTISTFNIDYGKTFGVKISMLDSEIEGNMIKLLFWDIAGRDNYPFVRPQFFKEVRAAIIVFSLEDNKLGKASFNHITEWNREVRKNRKVILIYLIANKVDLVDENKVDELRIKNLVDKNNFGGYCITSAISGSGIIKIFKVISEELYEKYKALFLE